LDRDYFILDMRVTKYFQPELCRILILWKIYFMWIQIPYNTSVYFEIMNETQIISQNYIRSHLNFNIHNLHVYGESPEIKRQQFVLYSIV